MINFKQQTRFAKENCGEHKLQWKQKARLLYQALKLSTLFKEKGVL